VTTEVTVTGTDCFSLAAQYLGDATEFYRIMVQNGLTDPVISGPPVVLVIPDVETSSTDGIPTL
jgi:hypothetical protein